MAIIYTYPKLLNPDGTELIVVSETKNQNATRLLTLGDICDFCEGGGGSGCTDTFKYIQTTSPARATADAGCGDELVFQSSDASITITNAGKTIDFVAVGGGGGACPDTYIIKPVTCDEGSNCILGTKLSEWIWTCDETLGALAPGYINNLTLNGTLIPHPRSGPEPDPDLCWYIELATLASSATSCEDCCDLVYKLVPCEEGPTILFTDNGNSSGPALSTISDYVNKTIIADGGEGNMCYNVTQEAGTPIATVTIDTPIPGFDDCECCQLPYRQYTPCQEGENIVIDIAAYPALTLVPPDTCITVKDSIESDWVCYQYDSCVGDNPQAFYDIQPSLTIPCCDEPLCQPNYKYAPCEGNPIGYDVDIVVSVDPGGYASGTVIESPAGGENIACYTIEYPTADPLSGVAPVITNVYDIPPTEGCECCMTPIRTYDPCDEGESIYIDVVDAGFSKNNPPQCIRVEYSEETICYNLGICEVGALQPGIISIVDNSPQCCEDELCTPEPGTLRYEKCPGDVCGDAPGGMPAYLYYTDNGSMPNHILVTDQSPGGQTWCYFLNDDGQNLPETPGYSYVTSSYPESCCPCEVYSYYDCNDVETLLYTNNIGIMEAGLNVWTIIGSTTCYQTGGVVPLPEPDLVINEIIIENNYPDCECCDSGVNPNIHEYNLCEGDPPYGPVGAPVTIFVDLTAWHAWNPVGLHPDYISADVGITENVCYTWSQHVCDPPDATQIADYVDCPACIAANPPAQMLELDNCGGGYTEYVLASDFTPDITGLSGGDVIYVSSGALSAIDECWTIQNMNSLQPASLGGNHDWTGPMYDPGGGIEDPCDCCYQHLYQYNVCAGAPGTACAPTAALTLTIDLGVNGANTWPVVPAVIKASENSTGIECCYTMTGPLPCTLATGTYVMTVTDCDPGIDINCQIT